MSATLTTPVALIIFNRPETTARVFAEIAKARPPKLLVIADGPRAEHPQDVERCAATRAIIERVDWPCEVLTNFSEANLGCKMRPVSGLNWVFENVEEAIILEDDCLPHPTFFRFCQELLERYRDDERVMMVSGLNLMHKLGNDTQSYSFSALGGTWGWSTWRRAWRCFDPEIKLWPQARDLQVVEGLFPHSTYSSYWKEVFQKVYDGTLETAWDYQWLLACWLQSGWRIVPRVNLIKNIGFGADATHHQLEDDPLASLAVEEKGGLFRLAVPDGNRRDPTYLAEASPPKDGHQVLYNLDSLTALLEGVGFKVSPLEYFDAREEFHALPWDETEGMIHRSIRFDSQVAFKRDHMFYTSLIVDARKI